MYMATGALLGVRYSFMYKLESSFCVLYWLDDELAAIHDDLNPPDWNKATTWKELTDLNKDYLKNDLKPG